MDIKKEIVDAIQILVDAAIRKTCPVISFGVVSGVGTKGKCTVKINNVDQNISYYGKEIPTINQKYPVFVPMNNMSLAFILTTGGGGGGTGGTSNYDELSNRPAINNVTLSGNKTSGQLGLEPLISSGTTEQYWRGDKTWQNLNKSTVGLGNVDNVKQYSASNPPPYPVQSVNGQSGNVELTYSDVNALSENTVIPEKTSELTNDSGFITASEAPVQSVNGQTGDVTVTGADSVYVGDNEPTSDEAIIWIDPDEEAGNGQGFYLEVEDHTIKQTAEPRIPPQGFVLPIEKGGTGANNNNDALKNLGARSNPNLIDNWWFGTGVINQRRKTTYSEFGSYSIDRWKMWCQSVSLANDGIVLVNGDSINGIFQKIENFDASKSVTVSVQLSDGTIEFVRGNNGQISTAHCQFDFSTAEVGVLGNANSSVKIRAVKLEYGNVSTLANDHVPNYTEEFIRCISSTADPADTYANKPYTPASNPNLLDNWWFGSGVVNQRGVTAVSSAWTYTIDRWEIGQNSLFELKNGYVKITGAMFEIAEILDALGKTVTASVKLHDGTILSASGIVTNTGAWHSILSKPEMYVAVTAGGLIEFCVRDCEAEAVKLEYGSVSTLANDHAPYYATELLKCQRYYYVISGDYLSIGSGYTNNATDLYMLVNAPVVMRGIPSISLMGEIIAVTNGGVYTATNPTIRADVVKSNNIKIYVNGFSNLPQFHSVFVQFKGTDSKLVFSADL